LRAVRKLSIQRGLDSKPVLHVALLKSATVLNDKDIRGERHPRVVGIAHSSVSQRLWCEWLGIQYIVRLRRIKIQRPSKSDRSDA
jgi:hypothetical protein